MVWATGSMFLIRSKNATFSDWKGSYAGGSVSLGFLSLAGGSSSKYSVYGAGFGYGWGGKSFRGASGSFGFGNTELRGKAYYSRPYLYGNGPYSNTYIGELIGL